MTSEEILNNETVFTSGEKREDMINLPIHKRPVRAR